MYFGKFSNVYFHPFASFNTTCSNCSPLYSALPSAVNCIVTLSGLFSLMSLLSSHIFSTGTSTLKSTGSSSPSSTVCSFCGVSSFIVPVALLSIVVLVTSTFSYTNSISLVSFISLVPCVYVSIPVISSVHVIVLSILL